MEMLFYRYGSICEPDLISVFTGFGLKVETMEIEMHNKSLPASERIARLSECIGTHTFSFVFTINFFPSISDLCEIYKLPYICWTVDSPVMELFSKSIKNQCNKVFVFDKTQYRTLMEYNPGGIFHLPLATNVNRQDAVIRQITDDDCRRFGGDISFVGSLYAEKDPYLLTLNNRPELDSHTKGFVDGVIAAQSQVYGFNFMESALTPEIISIFKKRIPSLYPKEENLIMNTDRYVTAHQIIGMHAAYVERIQAFQKLAQSFTVDLYTQSDASILASEKNIRQKGSVRTLTEMPKVFHLSKINLNITIRPIQSGLSLRIWDVLGCGGFLITNYQEELPDYFTPGVDLETFADLDELADKCRYYLSHEDIRLKIAQSGYKKVKDFHTYEKRVAELIRIVYETLQ